LNVEKHSEQLHGLVVGEVFSQDRVFKLFGVMGLQQGRLYKVQQAEDELFVDLLFNLLK